MHCMGSPIGKHLLPLHVSSSSSSSSLKRNWISSCIFSTVSSIFTMKRQTKILMRKFLFNFLLKPQGKESSLNFMTKQPDQTSREKLQ